MKPHKSGFVNIIGRPNVGKSTLLNALLGERLSVETPKAQTTRHRIKGILNEEDYQIIFSDTPGIVLNPAYEMHHIMNQFVKSTFDDADILVLIIDPTRPKDVLSEEWMEALKNTSTKKFLLLNKSDLVPTGALLELASSWQDKINFDEILPISALKKSNIQDKLLPLLLKYLPEGPPYYPKDQLTDRSIRFFISEIIRAHILKQFKEEVPYSCEVVVNEFKEPKTPTDITHIQCTIYVNRKSQKSILIGKQGSAIKKLGTAARYDIEKFLQTKVYLDLHVKVLEKWRDDKQTLRRFGYD